MTTHPFALAITIASAMSLVSCSSWKAPVGVPDGGEVCDNHIDDDADGAVDCVDSECREESVCQGNAEDCNNGLDDDLDGSVDCADADCASTLACSEDCGNGGDDNGDLLVDCADPLCKGIDPRCGEVCGDGVDNDKDSLTDCNDPDCFDVIPPCGGGNTPDGTMCNYDGTGLHVCACADGEDNDGDGQTDGDDIQCFGPFDDDEETYATGIPGDNNGSKGNIECPFDGNSGPGNDGVCCNQDNPEENVTPNGCDNHACCEIDVNGNLTGEHVYIIDQCVLAPDCGTDGTHGCPCTTVDNCDPGQYCVFDDDDGAGFCSLCEGCTPDAECENPCSCGEVCFGGFVQPESECGSGGGGGGGGGTCLDGAAECPNGNLDCNADANETCVDGCCYAKCPMGVTPCETYLDCGGGDYYCITGCCVIVPV